MSKYILKNSGSNEIITIIEWDGSTDLGFPSSSYSFELYTTASGYIQYVSESIYNMEQYSGEFYGDFSGDLKSSVTINGESIKQFVNDYDGILRFQTGSITNSVPYDGYFVLNSMENATEIALSNLSFNPDMQYRYENALRKITSESLNNYIIELKDGSDNVNLGYLVKNTQIASGSGSQSGSTYFKLDVEPLFDYSKISYLTGSFASTYFDSGISNIYVNFDLGDKPIVGQVYVNGEKLENVLGDLTGSFTGSFAGSAQLTGSFFGQFEGLLDGTASYAGYALTSSFTENASTVDVFLKSKNWTKPSWAKTIRVTCVGGGGGGGAAPATETSGIVAGGGGGSGGTITIGEFDADTLPSTISVTIGAGGNGGIYDGMILKFPSNGGDTYFGDYLIARGGNHGFNGGVESLRALGGSTVANIEYKNTGAGGGGAGTVDGTILNMPLIFDASMAPPLPLPIEYIRTGLGGPEYNYYLVIPTPIPAVIAPTGGGGGLGYDPDNGGRQDGVTSGGSISEYSLTNNNNKYKSLTPILYNSSSHDYYPGFNSKVGLGGKGGNPYLLVGPTDGTMYGGGGGGAYGGGVDGIYANTQVIFPSEDAYNGTEYNFGANGAIGAVIIISEA